MLLTLAERLVPEQDASRSTKPISSSVATGPHEVRRASMLWSSTLTIAPLADLVSEPTEAVAGVAAHMDCLGRGADSEPQQLSIDDVTGIGVRSADDDVLTAVDGSSTTMRCPYRISVAG